MPPLNNPHRNFLLDALSELQLLVGMPERGVGARRVIEVRLDEIAGLVECRFNLMIEAVDQALVETAIREVLGELVSAA